MPDAASTPLAEPSAVSGLGQRCQQFHAFAASAVKGGVEGLRGARHLGEGCGIAAYGGYRIGVSAKDRLPQQTGQKGCLVFGAVGSFVSH